MLQKYRKTINSKLVELQMHNASKNKNMGRLSDLNKKYNTAQEAKEIFQKAAILTQNHLAKHLSTIVTKAIRTVFYEKDISFLVEFVEKRGSTECDMWFIEDDKKYSLLDSRGYGMVDIASFALRIAYVLLQNSENILVIDEPFRNLSEDKHEIASQMVKELSTELNIQFIITTHMQALKEYADKAFPIIQSD